MTKIIFEKKSFILPSGVAVIEKAILFYYILTKVGSMENNK